MKKHRAGFALAVMGAVLALATPALAGGTPPPWPPQDPTADPSSIGNTLSGVSALTSTDAWTVGWYIEAFRPGDGREMLIERWNGTAWTQVATPDMPGSDEGLLGVSASSASEAWAVGFTDRNGSDTSDPLAVHWDGTAWTVAPNPVSGNASGSGLYGVVSLGPTNAWAVGDLGRLPLGALIEHWDGSSWSPAPSPKAATPGLMRLKGIAAVSPTDVWAVGEIRGAVVGPMGPLTRHTSLVEHYDGTAWSIVPSPNAANANGELNGVVAVGANDVWAVGDDAAGATLVEHWNGTAWSIVPSPNVPGQDTLAAVTASSPTDAWAVGSAVNGSGTVSLTLHWDGAAWSVVPSPNGPTGAAALLAAGVVPASGEVLAVGDTGTTPVDTFAIHR